jgi:hypothetical protein
MAGDEGDDEVMASFYYTRTPITEEALTQYDDSPGKEVAVYAWMNTGRSPAFHHRQQEVVRRTMPLVARALDRAAGDILPDEMYGEVVKKNDG